MLQLIPNLNDLNGLIPNQNLSTILQRKEVNQAFNTLGLDASMVEQFVPVLMQYLTQQGASQDLLASLGKLWQ
ncbi:VcgC [Vibrio cholerae]|uniref:VcgC n=1 Tax=Vibrio cholerae TaxID=666 RepID=A0A655VQP6_VIBCL|nr:VcgC [Vibrio cholerae]CSB93019.1 VcgC [Vibrio cholerae]CSC78063.1 VcgC [Vibrio cholerae]CSD23691.1 VcgC [Vibrio cholerae]CSI03595.1 VcgC [Vibrio cholerae]